MLMEENVRFIINYIIYEPYIIIIDGKHGMLPNTMRHLAKYDQKDMHCECIMYANQIKHPVFPNYMHHSYIDYKVILYIRIVGQIKHMKDMHSKCINIIQKITT